MNSSFRCWQLFLLWFVLWRINSVYIMQSVTILKTVQTTIVLCFNLRVVDFLVVGCGIEADTLLVQWPAAMIGLRGWCAGYTLREIQLQISFALYYAFRRKGNNDLKNFTHNNGWFHKWMLVFVDLGLSTVGGEIGWHMSCSWNTTATTNTRVCCYTHPVGAWGCCAEL